MMVLFGTPVGELPLIGIHYPVKVYWLEGVQPGKTPALS